MTHTLEVVTPHFSVKLLKQTRRIILSLADIDPLIHSIREVKLSAGPFTDILGKNATSIHMPRDSSGHVEFGLLFNLSDVTKRLSDYLGYTLMVFQKQLKVGFGNGEIYNGWELAEIRTSPLILATYIPHRAIVQLRDTLDFNGKDPYVNVKVSKSYTTHPSDALRSGSMISLYQLPKGTYLPAGSYIAGDINQKCSECIPELIYKLP